MPITTQQVLTELSASPMPSANIVNDFNVTGFEDNVFLKDWCMLINGLYLINREYYRDFELEYFEPKPKPYDFNSPTFDTTVYTVRIDLETNNFNIATNYQRDNNQPFNGVTASPMDMNSYTNILGETFAQCPWLIINFGTVSPMQFVLDTAKVVENLASEEDIEVIYSNKSSVMLANIKAQLKLTTPQVPGYENIVVGG